MSEHKGVTLEKLLFYSTFPSKSPSTNTKSNATKPPANVKPGSGPKSDTSATQQLTLSEIRMRGPKK